MKKQLEVVGAVVVKDGRVLCAQRGPQMSLPGRWEFPGGKVELDESPREALVREMHEEFRCTIEVGEQVETTRHEYDFAIVTLTTYRATLLDGEPELTEHAAMRWLDIRDLDSVPWAPADVPAVERLMATRVPGATTDDQVQEAGTSPPSMPLRRRCPSGDG